MFKVMFQKKYIKMFLAVALLVLCSGLLAQAAGHPEPGTVEIGKSLPIWSIIPFVGMLIGSFRTVNYNECFKRSEIFVIIAIIADIAFMGSMIFGLRAGTASSGYAALAIDLVLFASELLSAAFMLGACSKLAEQSGEESLGIACTNTKTIFITVSIIAFIIKPCIAFLPGNNNSAFLVLIIMSAVAVLGVNIMATMRFGNVCELLDGSRFNTENA